MVAAPHLPVSKPSRSEPQALDPHEQLRITEQVRLKFEADAPRRHAKPSRSDPNSSSAVEAATVNISATPIPEFLKFQSLIQAPMTKPLLITEFQNLDSEEFVETDYYKDLNAVDKTLHHTTGSGFIQVETSLPDDTSVVNKLRLSRPPHTFARTKSLCNPATNDWIPSPECGASRYDS